jgi:hypothetical protein
MKLLENMSPDEITSHMDKIYKETQFFIRGLVINNFEKEDHFKVVSMLIGSTTANHIKNASEVLEIPQKVYFNHFIKTIDIVLSSMYENENEDEYAH